MITKPTEFRIVVGDALEALRQVGDGAARCVVTSPPYWNIRDYRVDGQLGLEPTLAEYLDRIVEVFREVRRVLARDGTLWLNLGDCYATQHPGARVRAASTSKLSNPKRYIDVATVRRGDFGGLRRKQLVGLPWRVAFALQADGWFLRSDIVWSKPNPMPESVRDRPTRSHDYLFLFSRSKRYHYDAASILEPAAGTAKPRGAGVNPKAERDRTPSGWDTREGGHRALDGRYERNGEEPYGMARELQDKREGRDRRRVDLNRPDVPGRPGARPRQNASFSEAVREVVEVRNRRTVWEIPTQPFRGDHYATFPEALVEPCVLAGSAPGDLVLDPFCGAGTTGLVARRFGRGFLGVEINPAYAELARRRCSAVQLDLRAVAGAAASLTNNQEPNP